jgi:BirA family biotin operon repressor/biotin-[acetyl-CoA-carboxylase] ligase
VPEPTAPFRTLDVAQVRRALDESRFSDIRYVAQTGSTNDDATPLLARPDAAGATLVAEEQSAGRGRRPGRTWIARPGTSLLFTTILPAPVAATGLWAVPFWVALAVAEGIERTGVHVDMRWPNDLFVGGHKVAGILCVSRVTGASAHVGCGVGINVVRPHNDALSGIEPPPAFLGDVASGASRESVLADVLLAFDRRLAALHEPDAIARDYEARAELAGTPYRVRLDADGSELDGIVRGLGAEGTLRLDVGGTERVISLADARRL